mmetsp:Transcript_111556/g.193581  ORF Transcript_111556/g.193581 Transcript_111556/m.193581 type:complete len:216 (+) Transcript_111556:982-1629(+)
MRIYNHTQPSGGEQPHHDTHAPTRMRTRPHRVTATVESGIRQGTARAPPPTRRSPWHSTAGGAGGTRDILQCGVRRRRTMLGTRAKSRAPYMGVVSTTVGIVAGPPRLEPHPTPVDTRAPPADARAHTPRDPRPYTTHQPPHPGIMKHARAHTHAHAPPAPAVYRRGPNPGKYSRNHFRHPTALGFLRAPPQGVWGRGGGTNLCGFPPAIPLPPT